MSGLKVFVSSTCFDLSMVRSQLRTFILSMGYDPILSDYDDVLYDPRIHTHTSCVDEVNNCDMLILLIGSRYGGKSTVEALNRIDFDTLKNSGVNQEKLEQLDQNQLSITQIEVVKAIENSIPVYTFIDKRVWNDHQVYEKNKEQEFIGKIVFPSIEKQETAEYIFKFINFIRLRTKGNNIFTFEKEQDIENTLRKQWSGYFQRLLHEQRNIDANRKQMDNLNDKIDDLKNAILSSIGDSKQKIIANGIVKYRKLIEFVTELADKNYFIESSDYWNVVLQHIGIEDVFDMESVIPNNPTTFKTVLLIREDKARFYKIKLDKQTIEINFSTEWELFKTMEPKDRKVIVDTICELKGEEKYLRRLSKKEHQIISKTVQLHLNIPIEDEDEDELLGWEAIYNLFIRQKDVSEEYDSTTP